MAISHSTPDPPTHLPHFQSTSLTQQYVINVSGVDFGLTVTQNTKYLHLLGVEAVKGQG